MRKSVRNESALETEDTEVDDVERAEDVEDLGEAPRGAAQEDRDAGAVPDDTEAAAKHGKPVAGDPEAEIAEAGEEADVALEDAAQVRAERDALNDKHLRLAAEFNNFRRRTEQERLGTWSRAQAEIVGRMLTVLDDLQRVAQLDASNATVESIMEGIDLVERKFVRALAEAGVEVHDPLGQPFDPEFMEAMMRVPAESEDQDETVAQVFERGYSLAGTLIRPARVSVHVLG